MKNLNPLQIGRYTFWASFIIGNIFLFGYLFGIGIKNTAIYGFSAIYGFLYLMWAAIINIFILFALLIWGLYDINKRKDCFTGVGIMLINIPLAILYASLGIFLLYYFQTI